MLAVDGQLVCSSACRSRVSIEESDTCLELSKLYFLYYDEREVKNSVHNMAKSKVKITFLVWC